MAIKGWKKKNKTAWISIKNNVVNVVPSPDTSGKKWEVVIEADNVQRARVNKLFNSESQAKRFAIKFMRKHPNG